MFWEEPLALPGIEGRLFARPTHIQKNACHKKYHNSARGIPRWVFRSTRPWKHKGEGIAPCILKFQDRWEWMISITSRPLYPRERVFFVDRREGWVGFRAGLVAPEKLETDITSVVWYSTYYFLKNTYYVQVLITKKQVPFRDVQELTAERHFRLPSRSR